MSTTVTRKDFAERIARLEAELEKLKEDYGKLRGNGVPGRARTMADLYGIWSDLDDVSLEEIRKFEYKSRLDKDSCP